MGGARLSRRVLAAALLLAASAPVAGQSAWAPERAVDINEPQSRIRSLLAELELVK